MEKIVKKLESKGIRPTAMRLMTYRRLAQLNVAVSLGDLGKDFESSERSTLFRTMKTFEEKVFIAIVAGKPCALQSTKSLR